MKTVKLISIACVVMGTMAASTSASAAESLKKGAPKVKPMTVGEFAEARAKLGECIYKSNEKMAQKMFDHSDSVVIDYKAMGVDNPMFAFNTSTCMKYSAPQMMSTVYMAPNGLRQLLLESAYLRHFEAPPKPIVNDKGEPALAPPRAFVSTGDVLPGVVAFAQIADCTAATGSELADKLLRTAYGTPAERDAAVALAQNVMGDCISAGQDISLTSATIRSLAAEGMWHRYNPVPTAQASAK